MRATICRVQWQAAGVTDAQTSCNSRPYNAGLTVSPAGGWALTRCLLTRAHRLGGEAVVLIGLHAHHRIHLARFKHLYRNLHSRGGAFETVVP